MTSLLYTAVGWDMYDPRMTLKGEAGEDDIGIGACCWISSTNGEIYLSDDATSIIHGCALTEANDGDELVLVTHGRLRVTDSNTPGINVYGQLNAGGSAPNDTISGAVCGFSIENYLIFVHIDSVSAT